MYSRWKTCWNSAEGGSRLVGDSRVERALGGAMALGSCNAKCFPEDCYRVQVKTMPEIMLIIKQYEWLSSGFELAI